MLRARKSKIKKETSEAMREISFSPKISCWLTGIVITSVRHQDYYLTMIIVLQVKFPFDLGKKLETM